MNMINLPFVTVFLLTHNSEDFVKETLSSILAQDYPNFEVIISDNSSTDKTLEIVRSFSDSRMSVRKNICEEIPGRGYLGCYANYNGCIESGLGKGEYFCFFHADDVYAPEFLSTEVSFLEKNKKVGAVFSCAKKIDAFGNIIGFLEPEPGIFDFEDIFFTLAKGTNPLITPSMMVRKETLLRVGLFDEKVYGVASDVEMWLRISRQYPIGIIPEKLISYRIHESQGSMQYFSTRSGIDPTFPILNEYSKYLSNRHQEIFSEIILVREEMDKIFLAVIFILKGDYVGFSQYIREIKLSKLFSFPSWSSGIAIRKIFLVFFVCFLRTFKSFGGYKSLRGILTTAKGYKGYIV